MANKYYCAATGSSWNSIEPAVSTVSTQFGPNLTFPSGTGPSNAFNGLGATLWTYSAPYWEQLVDTSLNPLTLIYGDISGRTALLSGTPYGSALAGLTIYFCAGTSYPTSADNIFITNNSAPATLSILGSTGYSCNNLTISRTSNFVGGLDYANNRGAFTVGGAFSITGGCKPRFILNLTGSANTINMSGFTGDPANLSIQSYNITTQLSDIYFGQTLVASGSYYSNGYNMTVVYPGFTMSYYGFTIDGGTFNLTGNLTFSDVNQEGFNVVSGSIYLNSYTLTLPVFVASSAAIINPGGSTIKFSVSFTGAGKTYYDLAFNMETGPNYSGPMILDSCTFNTVYNTPINSTTYASISLGSQGGTTVSANSFLLSGTSSVPLQIYDLFYYADYNVVKLGGGTVTINHAQIGGFQASPASTFYAINSTELLPTTTFGTNVNVTFSAPSTGKNKFLFMF